MKHLNIYIIALFLFIVSCNSAPTTFIHSFEQQTWNFKEGVWFEFDVEQPGFFDLELFFQNTLDYPYRNIYLLIQTYHNDTLLRHDTLQYPITDKYGKWLGGGIGKNKNNYFLEEKKNFQDPGKYKIMITHGMRENPLAGTNKIGLKIIHNE